MTTMMISDLPKDLLEEILTRVPLQFTRAVRLTCKNWNALFKSRSFTTMHIGREEAAARELGESRMIVLLDYNLHLMSVVVNEIPITKFLGKLTTCLNDSEQIQISEVFHCEGLLLCVLKDDDTKFVVWNPYLGQIRWIQTKSYPALFSYYGWIEISNLTRYIRTYAVGYEKKKKNNNKSWRSYKILRFVDGRSKVITERQFARYEIYDFQSDSWTILDVSPDWWIPYQHHGVSLKGNTYWCASRRNCHGFFNYIICFDFTSERFGPLVPLPFGAREDGLVTLFCVREEKLAVFFVPVNTYMIEVWITTKIEATKVSWSKFLSFVMGTGIYLRISGTRVFIDEEKKIGVVFDKNREQRQELVSIIGEDGYIRELDLGERTQNSYWEFVCSYVPSLVQIKKQFKKRIKEKCSA